MGISSGPMTLKFSKSPHFQNRDFEKGKFFSSRAPHKSGQVCKKWSSRCTDRSGKRWTIFIYVLKMMQRGDHWMIFYIFLLHKTIHFCSFSIGNSFLTSFNLINQTYLYTQTYFSPIHVLHFPYQHSAQTQLVVVFCCVLFFCWCCFVWSMFCFLSLYKIKLL